MYTQNISTYVQSHECKCSNNNNNNNNFEHTALKIERNLIKHLAHIIKYIRKHHIYYQHNSAPLQWKSRLEANTIAKIFFFI